MRLRLSVAALLAAAALPAAAAERQLTMGREGEIYRVQTGRYGSLVASAPAAMAENTAMVLDITSADAPAQRIVVPGTEGPEEEQTPFVLYQDALDATFVIWQSRVNFLHSQFFLTSYANGRWSDSIALTTEVWTIKTPPQIAVTTDTYRAPDAEGKLVQHRRTVVHTLWWEEGGSGERAVYSPVVLIDGSYVGQNPLQALDEIDPSPEAAASIALDLRRSPNVIPGRDQHAVIVSFANPKTGKLLNLEVEMLPWPLTELASETRDAVLDQETQNLQNIVDGARAHILVSGARWFNRRFLTSLANEVATHIQDVASDQPGASLTSLADAARAHILVAGVDLSGHALADSRPVKTLSLASDDDPSATPYLLLQFRVASIVEVPTTPAAPTTLLASADGTHMLVVWQESPERLSFRESDDSGWSAVRSLPLDSSMSRDRALQILSDRIRTR